MHRTTLLVALSDFFVTAAFTAPAPKPMDANDLAALNHPTPAMIGKARIWKLWI